MCGLSKFEGVFEVWGEGDVVGREVKVVWVLDEEEREYMKKWIVENWGDDEEMREYRWEKLLIDVVNENLWEGVKKMVGEGVDIEVVENGMYVGMVG